MIEITDKHKTVRRHYFLGSSTDFWLNGLVQRMSANGWSQDYEKVSFAETQRIYLPGTEKNPLLCLERLVNEVPYSSHCIPPSRFRLSGLLLAKKTGAGSGREIYSFREEIGEYTYDAMLHQGRLFAKCKKLPSYNIIRTGFYNQFQVTKQMGRWNAQYSHMYTCFDVVTGLGGDLDGVYAAMFFHPIKPFKPESMLHPDNNDGTKVMDRVLPAVLGELGKLKAVVETPEFYVGALKRRHQKFPW